MSKEMINRRLEAAKKEIAAMQKQSVNTVPAGVPSAPPEAKDINAPSVPGFITGGKRVSKKQKEV
jgi:hypothetical protein